MKKLLKLIKILFEPVTIVELEQMRRRAKWNRKKALLDKKRV